MTKQEEALRNIQKTEENVKTKREKEFEQEEQQVSDLLNKYGLKRKIIPKDGSCLFRAVSDQLFHTQKYQKYVRKECVKYIEQHRDEFEAYIWDMPFDKYCKQMKNENAWGGQIEVEALCRRFGYNIIVYSRRGIEAEHKRDSHTETINLCFSHGNHYDSVYSAEFFEKASEIQDIIYEMLESRLNVKESSECKGTFRNVEYEAWLEQMSKQSRKDRRKAKKLSYRKKAAFPSLPVRKSSLRSELNENTNDSMNHQNVEQNSIENNDNIDKKDNNENNENNREDDDKKEPAWGKRVDWKEMFAKREQEEKERREREANENNEQHQQNKEINKRSKSFNETKSEQRKHYNRNYNNNNNKNYNKKIYNKKSRKHKQQRNNQDKFSSKTQPQNQKETNITKYSTNTENISNDNNTETENIVSSRSTTKTSSPNQSNNPWSRSKGKPSFSDIVANAVIKDEHQDGKDETINQNNNNNNNNNNENNENNNQNTQKQDENISSLKPKKKRNQKKNKHHYKKQFEHQQNGENMIQRKKKQTTEHSPQHREEVTRSLSSSSSSSSSSYRVSKSQTTHHISSTNSTSSSSDINSNHLNRNNTVKSSTSAKICFGEFDEETSPFELDKDEHQTDDIIQSAKVYALEDKPSSSSKYSKPENDHQQSHSPKSNVNEQYKSSTEKQQQQQQQQPPHYMQQQQQQQPIPTFIPPNMHPTPASAPMQQHVHPPSFSPDSFPTNGTPGHVTVHSGAYGYPMPPSPLYPMPPYGFYPPPPMMQPHMMQQTQNQPHSHSYNNNPNSDSNSQPAD